MKRTLVIMIVFVMALVCTACGSEEKQGSQETDTQKIEASEDQGAQDQSASEGEKPEAEDTGEDVTVEEKAKDLALKIGGKTVDVKWAKNESVDVLRKIAFEKPLEINMSMYDDFEQVGELGQSLPAADKNITTEPGDIMLYSGSNIVIFYGSNTWEYTRLGKIEGLSDSELKKLLGSDDVTVSISME